ncbi:MAG: 30S ribosomal protein S20 [Candidatus Buchananbacteria bacterium]
MPIKKAAIKDLRQNEKRAKHNRKIVSDIDALLKNVRHAIVKKDETKAKEWLQQAMKKIDKATQKKVLKKNTAARKKSRLFKAVNALKK